MSNKDSLALASDTAKALGGTGGAILTVGALAVGGIYLGARALQQIKQKQEREKPKHFSVPLAMALALSPPFSGMASEPKI